MGRGLRFSPGQVGSAQFWVSSLLLGSPHLAPKPRDLCCLGWGDQHEVETAGYEGSGRGSMVLLMGKEICVLESGGMRQREGGGVRGRKQAQNQDELRQNSACELTCRKRLPRRAKTVPTGGRGDGSVVKRSGSSSEAPGSIPSTYNCVTP